MTPIASKRGRPRTGSLNAQTTTIRSVDRALDILESVAEHGGMNLTQIAAELGQSPSTVYRVLTTLEQRQIVEVDHATQAWHVGPATFRLGSSFLRRTGLAERSRPVMRHLMETTGETANLGIERGGLVLFVSQVETHETIRAFFPPGTRSPMYCSGIGKALLGQYPEDLLQRYIRKTGLQKYTNKTITDAEHLRQDLEQIRQLGYAFDDEERTEGMRCIAAPVLDQYGDVVAGISVSGPTSRMAQDKIPVISAEVLRAAMDLSRALGAPPGQLT